MLLHQSSKKPSFITFRRWTRKSYAVFNSLSKAIRIGVLWLGCSILTLPVSAQINCDTLAVKDPIKELELDEVVVSAQRAPAVQSELMRVVQVISRAEIERSASNDLSSLLQYVRGVDIRARGPHGVQADVGIRGGTFDQTLILLNGINISDPQTGHHHLNMPVDIQSIERIEVLQGPGARVFGPNAFNGAINIITSPAGQAGFAANLSAGEFGYFTAGVSGGFKTGKIGHGFSVQRSGSDGFIENTDFSLQSFYYRLGLPTNKMEIDLQAGLNHKAFGANSFYTPRFPEQFEQTRSQFVSLQASSKTRVKLLGTLFWRRHHDRFELFRNEAPAWYAGHNYHRTDVLGASINWKRNGGFGKTLAGIDYRFEHIYSNVLGETLSKPLAVGGVENAWFTRAHARSGLSFLLEQNIYLGRFSFSGGALVYLNSDLNDRVGFFPGLDMGWQMNENLRFYASANKTLRLPTFTDLFYSGPANLGNPALLPEEALSLETGIKWNEKSFSFDAAVFHRIGKNLIDWVKAPGEELWKSMNHTQVNISGFETGVVIRPFVENSTSLRSASFSLQYAALYADKISGELVSNYVLDHLKHQFQITSYIPLTSQLGIDLRLARNHRNGAYMLYYDGAFTGLQVFEPYWLADANVQYRLGQLTLSAGATNLLNSHYVSIANVPQPGRWFIAGASWKW
jgi:iron complex outermembrane receptor protein